MYKSIYTGQQIDDAIGNMADMSAENTSYDNTTSGLVADDVQEAIDELQAEKVPTTRTVNSKALSSNISLTASDVGAVPTTRTVNSKALSSDITISQTDVGGAEILLKSTSYTLALTDNYKLNKCLSASTITVTIPLNSVVAFPVGSEIVLARYGAGAVTLSATSGVTLYSSDSKKSINKQYEFATLKKIATDEWVLLGSLSA